MEEKEKGFSDRFKETLDTIKEKAQNEDTVKQGANVFVYAVLFIGLILTFFSLEWGAFCVGLVLAIVFSDELLPFFKNLKGWIQREGLGKSIVLGGLLIFLLIALPLGVIGAALGLLIRSFLIKS